MVESLLRPKMSKPVSKEARGEAHTGETPPIAVDMLLREDRTKLPALICLPVSYAAGGTTRE